MADIGDRPNFAKETCDMAKTKKVSFVAMKDQPTRVAFTTSDGERVRFTAEKPQLTRVTFRAKK